MMEKKRRSLKHYAHRLQPFWDGRAAQGVIGAKQRAYGIDLSRWEPRWHADQAQQGLIDFVFVKATQDVAWKDPAFEQLYVDMQPAAVKGAFHYLSSGWSGTDQAAWFLKTIGSKGLDALIVDAERYGNTMNDAYVRALYECLKEVQIGRRSESQKVLLYTNPDVYDNVLFPTAMRLWGRDVFADWELWVAQYYWTVNPDGEPSMKTRKNWKFWQISDAGDPLVHGTEGWCDRNVFNGGLSELLAWAGIGSVPEPPPDGGDMGEVILGTVMTASLNIRGVPSSSNNVPIGQLAKGQLVMAAEKQNGWWRITHINHVPVAQESWAFEGVNNGYIRQDGVITTTGETLKPAIHVSHVFSAAGYPDFVVEGEWKPNA